MRFHIRFFENTDSNRFDVSRNLFLDWLPGQHLEYRDNHNDPSPFISHHCTVELLQLELQSARSGGLQIN
jgi:hypothetical protein